MLRTACWWLLVSLFIAACGGGSSARPADAALELSAMDVEVMSPPEAAVPEVPVAEASPEVSTMDRQEDRAEVPARCASDAECTGNPAGAVCDQSTGRCVGCVPSMDACPAAQHCDPSSNRCVAGCRDDMGCAGAGGSARRCNVTEHACVDCVTDAHCTPGRLCVGNLCVSGCNAARPCPTGQECCAGACADTLASLVHCGGCDRRCELANATPMCRNGVCSVGMCAAPFADCDMNIGNGCEANTQSDIGHCGACSLPCGRRPNAASRCSAGRCEYSCEEGFADCDTDPTNGCEVDTRTSVMNCGACARGCTPPNAVGVCSLGGCTVGSCSMGFGDCDMNPGNGCETDVRTSVSHCGRCGGACPAGPNSVPGCVSSGCVASCVAGFAECNSMEADGCEADLRASTAHCGGCGRSCATNLGTSANMCRMGLCSPECSAGYGDCDTNPGNGCEANLRTDPRSCGACGRTGPISEDPSPARISQSGMSVAASFPGSAVDDLTTTLSFHVDSSLPGAFLRIDLGAGNETSYVRIRLYMHATEPSHRGVYDIQYSDDDRVFRTARAGFAPSEPLWNEVSWPSVGAHRYWRLLLTNTPGGGSWVYELELFRSCELVCAVGTGDCDGTQANGCEARLDTQDNCGGCARRPPELCNGIDDNCNGMIDEAVVGCTAAAPGASCLDIQTRGASRGDGAYFITVSGAVVEVQCLMSRDGGGWTLAGNFPWPGSTAGVRGWNGSGRVGTVFTDLSRPFKLSDAEVNGLRTNGFRAHGTASRCCCIPGVGNGPCAIDTTLFWRPSCGYASASNSAACAAAFLDPGFTRPSPAGASPCGHHYGLTSVTCGSSSAMGTSHSGEHVFVGNVSDFAHAYDGREGENPTVRFWVR